LVDPERYCEEVLRIKDKAGKELPLIFNSTQKIVYEKIKQIKAQGRPVKLVILKARQQGISTMTEGLIFHDTATRFNRNSLIISHDPESTKAIFKMAKFFYENLLADVRPMKRYSNRQELVFENPDEKKRMNPETRGLGSQIEVQTASKTEARSRTIQNFHGSEVAFWVNAEDLMIAAMQMIPDHNDTMIVLESTANGIGGYFCDTYWAAKNGKNDFEAIFLPWWIFPEYSREVVGEFILTPQEEELKTLYSLTDAQLNWRRYCIANKCGGDEIKFRQEFPSCVSGDTEVATLDGIMKIKDIQSNQRGILGHWFKGKKDVYTIKTEMGYEVDCTLDHKILMNNGFKELSNIKEGDVVQLGMPSFNTNKQSIKYSTNFIENEIKISNDFARFLGIFMGDGSFASGDGVVSVACDRACPEVVNEVERLFDKYLGGHHTRITGTKKGCVEVRKANKLFTKAFKEMGIVRKRASGYMRKVCVPSFIKFSPKNVIRQFLIGLFEADGFVDRNGNRVVLFSKYKKFLRDVQFLLLGFGITARLRTANKRSSGGHEYIGYELIFRRAEAYQYKKELGFISQKKKERIALSNNTPRGVGAKMRKLELCDKVVGVMFKGNEEVYDIATDSHEFIANGIIVHNCDIEAFITSGLPRFNLDNLQLYRQNVPKPIFQGELVSVDTKEGIKQPELVKSAKGCLKLYKLPSIKHSYVIGGDTAKGTVWSDYSCLQVIDKHTGDQVAVWHGKIDPTKLAYLAARLGYFYRGGQDCALIGIEVNKDGITTNKILHSEIQYPRLYRRRSVDRTTEKYEMKLGFHTNERSRELILNKLARWIIEGEFALVDEATIMECMTFVYDDKGKAQAQEGCYDDLVMSLAIALHIFDYNIMVQPQKTQEEKLKEMLKVKQQIPKW